MNDLLSDTRFWLVTLGSALAGLVRYLFVKHTAETKERLDKLEADMVRRKEFDQLRHDMRDEHEENSGRLDRIETGITGTHKRLDDLYRDLIGRSGQR